MFVTMGVRLAFPPFSFDRDERVLRRGDTLVPLPPKVADALALLLADPGALVAKEALRDSLWPEGFVEDGNLTQTIYILRRALDPDGDGRHFIETIPRRGYRFVPPVSVDEVPVRTWRARLPFLIRSLAASVVIVLAFGGISLGGSRSDIGSELTGEAARAYALGRYSWNRRTEAATKISIEQFRRVVELAPGDARGYAGLADAYAATGDWEFKSIASPREAYRRAERYAREALRRDPRSGEALTSLGAIALDRDKDLDRAELALREALQFSPDHAFAYELYGIVRLYRGDVEGGRLALRRATELDPLSPIDLIWYGKSLYYAHRYAEARAAFRQLLQFDANNLDARELLACTDVELGNAAEARAMIAGMTDSHHKDKAGYRDMLLAFTDIRAGRTPHKLPDLHPRMDPHVDTELAAAVSLALGRRSDALGWVEIGLHDPGGRVSRKLLELDPRFAALRDDRRFRQLVS